MFANGISYNALILSDLLGEHAKIAKTAKRVPKKLTFCH